MEKDSNNRTRWLHVRLTEAEYESLQKAFKKTTTRKLSDYCRRVLSGKPIIESYRNSSLDDLMHEFIKLRKDLNGIANNFNQAVHKLHTLDHSVQFQNWLITYELEKKILISKVDEVRNHIAKMGEKWLQ